MQSSTNNIIKSGKGYKLVDGIFITDKTLELQGNNKKYSSFYNIIATLYDIGSRVFFGFYGGETKARNEFLEKIHFIPNSNVLEVSIGTGIYIQILQKIANYYGVDISYKILKKCKKNLLNSMNFMTHQNL